MKGVKKGKIIAKRREEYRKKRIERINKKREKEKKAYLDMVIRFVERSNSEIRSLRWAIRTGYYDLNNSDALHRYSDSDNFRTDPLADIQDIEYERDETITECIKRYPLEIMRLKDLLQSKV